MINTQIIAHYEDWWNKKNNKPPLYAIYPKKGKSFHGAVKPWMGKQLVKEWSNWKQEMIFGQAVELAWKTGEHHYIDDTVAFYEEYLDTTGHDAQGFSFLLPGVGPGVLSAFITDFTKFNGDTIWFELEKPWSFEKLQQITLDSRSFYADVAIQAVKELVSRLKGKFVFAPPDLAGPLDILSSIRTGYNLLLDTMDYAEELLEVVERVEKLWRSYFAELSAIIDPVNDGLYTNVFRYLSSKPMHTCICDFSAMISPSMFEELVLPTVMRDAEQFDGRLIYHLDGPGEIVHVDALCRVEKLHSIQWVPGAGNDHGAAESWFPLFKKILEGGKRICLTGYPSDPEALKPLFKAFPKEEFVLSSTFKSEEDCLQFINVLNL
ncbi:MAG: hypothetical protein WCI88_04565 [Chloroflexota bacterium]